MTTTDPQTPLDRLLAQVRAQRPPTPLEPGLPARLRAEFRSWAADPRAARSAFATRRHVLWSRSLFAAAVFGAVALGAVVLGAGALLLRPGAQQLAGPTPAPSRPVHAAPMGPPAVEQGDALALDVPLVASDAPRRVQHGSRASWVLAPGSTARLLSAGSVLRVALERGSLEAQVQPSALPESFIVRAGGTEVAVHGTRFRVAADGERAHVEVLEGVVLVRPVGQSAGIVLSQNMESDFVAGALAPQPAPLVERSRLPQERAADQKRAAPPAAAPRASSPVEPWPAPVRPTPPARVPASAMQPPVPAASPEQAAASERTLQLVTEHVQDCVHSQLPRSRELGIELSTRLVLWVQASGQLLRADFEPPLAPTIESCVAEKLVQFRATPSPEGYRIERDLVLQR